MTIKTSLIPSLLAAAFITYSCGDTEKTKTSKEEKTESRLEKASWLIGVWESDSEEGKMSETWVKDNADSYSAKTYFVIGKDTVFRELSKLEETGSNLQCVISIEGENDEKPVVFKMTKQEDQLMIFENPKHDFPTAIRYELKGDSVIAEISGMQQGKSAKQRFAMVRVR